MRRARDVPQKQTKNKQTKPNLQILFKSIRSQLLTPNGSLVLPNLSSGLEETLEQISLPKSGLKWVILRYRFEFGFIYALYSWTH